MTALSKRSLAFTIFILISIVPVLNFGNIMCFGENSQNRDYYISEYKVDVAINPDGSADYTETQTYTFNGTFNGIHMDIDNSQSDGLTNPRVFLRNTNNLVEFKRSTSTTSGTFNFLQEREMSKFTVYEPSSNTQKTFVFKYRLLDTVTKYNDIAEFNRKLLGSNFEKPRNNISAKITIPLGAFKEELKVFAHGPLTGESKILDEKTFDFTVSGLNPGSFLEARILFPPKLVPNCKKIESKNALTEIMDREKKMAEEANQTREMASKNSTQQPFNLPNVIVKFILPIGLFCFWLGSMIVIYIKYDRELRSSFKEKYFRELPGQYSPAEMSYLIDNKKNTTKDLMATLIDLVQKGIFKMESNQYTKNGIFFDSQITDYIFHPTNSNPPQGLKSHEEKLISMLFDFGGISGTNGISMELLKENLNNPHEARSFASRYKLWSDEVESEALKNNFFDENITKIKNKIIIFYVLLTIASFAGIALISSIFVPLLIISFISIFYLATLTRRTNFGNDQYRMWLAFKRFLTDFSRMEHNTLPSVVIWEHYLVYAISLGVAKEVIKELPHIYTLEELRSPSLTYLGTSMGYHSNFENATNFTNIFDTFNDVESSMNTAISPKSSSSGSGGGFSSGSSGGGGGSSGGGAF